MKNVKVAATQMSCSWDTTDTLNKAETLVRDAAKQGAQVILLQELFETPYFCQERKYEYIELATNVWENKAVASMKKIAEELDVVIPVSIFERSGNLSYNSVVVIDAGGSVLGVYRKIHIPDGLLFQEKFYFAPGDTGFTVWNTKYARIGIGICWDQWFPETARSLAILGAELLLFPSAIGFTHLDKADMIKKPDDLIEHWRLTMRGHAAANIIPVISSNRIGIEETNSTAIEFFGSSFITNELGKVLRSADTKTQGIIIAEFDLDRILIERRQQRKFRDRRPEMYGYLMYMDASNRKPIRHSSLE